MKIILTGKDDAVRHFDVSSSLLPLKGMTLTEGKDEYEIKDISFDLSEKELVCVLRAGPPQRFYDNQALSKCVV